MERLGGFALQNSNEIERRLSALAFSELTRGRRRLVIERVDDERTIANGPCVRQSFNSHIRASAYASSLFGNIEALHNRRDRSTNRADDRGSPKHPSILELDSLMRCCDRAGIEQHRNTRLLHSFLRKFPELRCYLGQNLVLRMDQRDSNIAFLEIPIETRATANEFIDFSGDLHTAEARAHNDEVQIPAPAVGII